MLIDRVDLLAFGRFTQASLNFGTTGNQFHLVFGKNESGKSTSLRAITSWLFGIDARTPDNYVHAYQEMRVGGRLVSEKFGALECVRRKGVSRTLKTIDETADADETLLARMLGNLDQESFLRGFGLDRERLIDGGREIMRGEGDLGQILFGASTGVQHLGEILRTLEQRQQELFKPSGIKPDINQACREITSLNNDLKAHILTKEEYERRLLALETAERKAADLAATLRESRQGLLRARHLREARPLAERRHWLVTELQELADVPVVDVALIEARREAETGRQVVAEQLAKGEVQIVELRDRLSQIPIGAGWLQFGERIETLRNCGLKFDTQSTARGKLEARQSQLQSELAELLGQLGRSVDDNQVHGLQLLPTDKDKIWKLIERSARLDQINQANRLEIERIEAELASFGTSGDAPPVEPLRLRAVLKTHSNPRSLVEQNARLADEQKRLEKRAAAGFKKLCGFRGELSDLPHIQAPSAEAVRQCSGALAKAVAASEQQSEKLAALRSTEQGLAAELAGYRGAGNVPNDAELTELRTQRDVAFTAFASNREAEPEPVKRLIEQADRAVDAMRAAADQVAARNRAECELITTRQRIVDQELRMQAANTQQVSVESEWRELWSVADVDPASSAEMSQWLSHHESVLEILDQMTAIRENTQANTALINKTELAIRDAVDDTGKEFHDDDPELCYQWASEVLDSMQISHEAHKHRIHEKERAEKELRIKQFELSQNQIEQQQWRQEWADAIKLVGDDRDSSTDAIRARLSIMETAAEKQSQLLTCNHDLQQWTIEYEVFDDAVKALMSDVSGLLAPDFVVGGHPARLAEQLYQAWQTAVIQEQRRELLGEQIDAAVRQIDDLSVRASQHRATLDACCRELRCERIEDLPDVERRSQEKQRYQQDLSELENQLIRLADGQILQKYYELALSCDAEQLPIEIERFEITIEQTEPALEAAQQRVGGLRTEVEAMDGGGTAAEISQAIQDRHAKAVRLARRYASLAIQASVLKQAVEAYRERHQGPILELAATIFKQLTCGDYHTLKPYLDDRDARILIGVRGANNEEVKANLMSEGTADALFLALRLAGLETHVDVNGPMPLILDDILVQFDDARALEALRVLSNLGNKTQVVFFTHHQHLVTMLQQNLNPDQYHLHELA